MEKQSAFARRWLLLQLPFFLFVLAYATAVYFSQKNGWGLFSCRVASELHFYCPGCGGSRAVLALCRGRILSALRFYAPLPITAALLLLSDARMLLFLLGKGRFPTRRFGYTCMVICLAAVFLQFILRNALLFFGIDLLGDIIH
ncbi:MAG: DUF2752 domain-containing protein [Clostridia bacterium]|nr:DUF2752 domain-containing protein [Clostridia bacterium]